ncbi:BsuPI-related putative proteinase inhibitor [Bacillaceae bacterium IKA-2]|nr:BsuPI-related putative proteinase inhibitor [Bacillaceae bacterium IKA-2]
MIEENSFTFSFEQEENIDGLFYYTLKNVSSNNKPIELVFSSSQEIDYVISDLDENELYQYSKENFFTQAMMYKTIGPNEEYIVNVDFRDVFSSLEDEEFDIEIWTVAKGLNARAKIRVILN